MTAKQVFLLFKETVTEWTEDRAPRLGAALAYYAVFSIAPVLIIAIAIASAVFGAEAEVQEQVVGQIRLLIGPQGAVVIDRMIDQASLPGDANVMTTAVGVVSLLFGGLGVFGQLQDAFDTIWEVRTRPRGLKYFLQNRLISFAMVLVVGFLLLVSLIVNAVLAAVGDSLSYRMPNFALVSTLANLVVPFVVITVLFAVLLKVLPNVEIAWRDVWPGAVLTSLLFTIGKFAIGFYLGNSRIGNASGAAGSLLIILVWIYYSAQILFFGAEFTQVYIRHFGRRLPTPTADAVPVTEHDRARQGIPHREAAGQPEPARALAIGTTALPRQATPPGNGHRPAAGYTGALVGFAAGVGAGVMMALRTVRHGSQRCN